MAILEEANGGPRRHAGRIRAMLEGLNYEVGDIRWRVNARDAQGLLEVTAETLQALINVFDRYEHGVSTPPVEEEEEITAPPE